MKTRVVIASLVVLAVAPANAASPIQAFASFSTTTQNGSTTITVTSGATTGTSATIVIPESGVSAGFSLAQSGNTTFAGTSGKTITAITGSQSLTSLLAGSTANFNGSLFGLAGTSSGSSVTATSTTK